MTDLECVPYAVGHANEGVCILLTMGPYQVLLDCGLRDVTPLVSNDWVPNDEGEFASNQRPPADVVYCSHAHADHARGLLALHRLYPDLPMYGSQVTAKLLPLNWLNEAVPDFCAPVEWRSPVEIFPNLTLQLWPAGHLPGASAALFTYHHPENPRTVFYTGDFLLANSRLVDGLPLDDVRGLKPDVLIIEGSYGTARHAKRRQQENQLAEKIYRAIAHGKSVLLPTPILGLGQELLMLLRSHHHFTGKPIDIWVTSNIAAGCDAYLDLLPHFPSSVQNFARHQPLFWDDRIRPRVRRLEQVPLETLEQEGDRPIREQILAASEQPTPCIVLADSATPLAEFCGLDDREWLLLLPRKFGQTSSVEKGVCDQIQFSPTLQTCIQSGRLVIDSYLLGDHCDGPGTLQFIHNLRPQHVVFVHGAPSHLTDLTSLEELQNRYQLHLPSADMRLELPVGDLFIQPAPPEQVYEGELTELKSTVLVTLPKSVTEDERWRDFSDTGLLDIRWQGNDLVIRGIQQNELLEQDRTTASADIKECCDHCAYYRGQRCGNPKSSLFDLKVTPEGYCPAFEYAYGDASEENAERE